MCKVIYVRKKYLIDIKLFIDNKLFIILIIKQIHLSSNTYPTARGLCHNYCLFLLKGNIEDFLLNIY